MPLVAILGAIIADVVAGAAVAGTVGGIAAISTVTAFEVVAAVGATVGAIGVVTKDKTLSTVGLAIGAIGGIGGLASSAGLLGAAAASDAPIFGAAPAASTSAFGGAASDASSAAGYGPTSAFDTGNAAGAGAGMSTADAASSGTINFVAGMDQPPPTDLTTMSTTSENVADPAKALTAANGAATDTTNNILSGGTGTSLPGQTGSGADAQAAVDATGVPPPPPSGLGTTNPATGQNIENAVDPVTGKITSLPDSGSGGIFSGILAFANKNPVATLGALQTAGSFLSGATSTLTPAQVDALNAQAAANQAVAAQTTRQNTVLAMPKSVASSTPVTGAPGALVPSTPGLINSAPRLAPVTGAPA